MKRVSSFCIFFVIASTATGRAALPVSDAAFSGRLGGLRNAILLDAARTIRPKGATGDLAYRLVAERLQGSGVPDAFVRGAFADPGVTVDQRIIDRFNRPAETKLTWEQYRAIFMKPERIARGVEFYREHKELVDAIASDTGVDAFVILSIAGVESYYGRHHAQFTVFNALYTAIHGVPKRRNWAAKELASYLKMSWRERFPPHSISGSYAGAFGYTQFIPTSWEAYSVDRDGDGVREPYEWADALASTANYLLRNGYRPGETDFSRNGSAWTGVYAYNHYEFYARVVLEFRGALKTGAETASK